MAAFDRTKTMLAAEKFVRAGKLLEAVAEYKKLADDNPRDLNTVNKLGDLLVRAGKGQEALRYFLRIAEFYAKDGFYLKAIAMYKKICKLDPSSIDAEQRLAHLYQQQGLASEAKAQYLHIADHFMRKSDTAAASEALQKVLEIEPDNNKVRVMLAEILGRSSKSDDAALEFGRVARAAIGRGALEESVQALRRAIKADAASPELPELLLLFLVKMDAAPVEFVTAVEEVARKAARSGKAAVAVAESYRRAGRKAEAQAAFKRIGAALDNFEDEMSAEALAMVSRFHSDDGRDGEGFEWLTRATEKMTVEGRPGDAAVIMDRFLASFPGHREGLSERAAIAFKTGDTESESTHLFRLAPILIDAQDLERAQEVVARLMSLCPADPQVETLRGRLAPPVRPTPAAPVLEAAEESSSEPVRSLAEEEAASAEEVFNIEEEQPEATETATTVPYQDALEQESEPELEADYGPNSKIQEIQAVDVSGQPIDEDFISEHLTEAEVFVKYGLLEKAREQLQTLLKRYPQHATSHLRLKDIFLSEGNREMAVRECLALADIKKAEGHDAEMRELVNEAIRIGGPGNPLAAQYAAALDPDPSPKGRTIAVAPPAPATEVPRKPERQAGRPKPMSPADLEAVLLGETETSESLSTGSEGVKAEDIEIEIDMSEDSEPEPVPARKPAAQDFAATTARSILPQKAKPEPAPERVEEESPDDFASTREAARTEEPEDELDIAVGGAGAGDFSPTRVASDHGIDPDSEKLGEVDFYMEQGLTDEARQVLFQLQKQHPRSRAVTERLDRLDHPESQAVKPVAGRVETSDLDFEVEQALGGKPAGQAAAKESARRAGKKEAAPKAEKAKPVFRVESHNEGNGSGDFFDLAGELDKSLAEAQAEVDAHASEGLEGPGHSFDEVFAAFKKGVEQQVDSEDFDTHYNLGIAYKEMGLVDEAIGEFQFAARDPSRALECCGILGVCFRDKGMHELALKWYKRGLDMPDLEEHQSIGLRYDMAEAYREKGDFGQALKMYTEVYGVDSTYRDVSARIKEMKGQVAAPGRR
jgi:tetratricopeptide (TPR) repeat protein